LVASYGKIIPKAVINLPKYQTLNIHPSLLPKYRGPSPLQGQILNGEKEVGVTIMLIDEQVDHGPLLAQEKINIPNWPVNFNNLEKIMAQAGAKLFIKI
jgi:methionyl-tRNA formyltransferase